MPGIFPRCQHWHKFHTLALHFPLKLIFPVDSFEARAHLLLKILTFPPYFFITFISAFLSNFSSFHFNRLLALWQTVYNNIKITQKQPRIKTKGRRERSFTVIRLPICMSSVGAGTLWFLNSPGKICHRLAYSRSIVLFVERLESCVIAFHLLFLFSSFLTFALSLT